MVRSVTFRVLPVTVSTVVNVTPLSDFWREKSRVFQAENSPPAPAFFTTQRVMWWLVPRSTFRNLLPAALELSHHLEPHAAVPSTALPGISAPLHDEEAVTVLVRATFDVGQGPH